MNVDPIYWLLPAGILFTPLVAFAIILFFGKYIDKYCDKIAIMAMSVALVFSVALFSCNVRDNGIYSPAHPMITSVSWLNLAGVDLQMGFLVDNLSSFMCIV